VFERFTENAKRVIVDGQEAGRRMRHAFYGTEHLLLGVVAARSSNAITMLAALDVSPAALASRLDEILPPGLEEPGSQIPFTPRAKTVLELALRQAIELGDAHIGTEHLLLALIEEGDGVAAQVLVSAGLDRDAVLRALPPPPRVDPNGREPRVSPGEAAGTADGDGLRE
jgi:ATP-dependent Clp protease ATP-binding subunit ClpC